MTTRFRTTTLHRIQNIHMGVDAQRLGVRLSVCLRQTCAYQEHYPTSVRSDDFSRHGGLQSGGGKPSESDCDQIHEFDREFQVDTDCQCGVPSARILLRMAAIATTFRAGVLKISDANLRHGPGLLAVTLRRARFCTKPYWTCVSKGRRGCGKGIPKCCACCWKRFANPMRWKSSGVTTQRDAGYLRKRISTVTCTGTGWPFCWAGLKRHFFTVSTAAFSKAGWSLRITCTAST